MKNKINVLITNIASITAISLIKILRNGKLNNIVIYGIEAQKFGYNSGSLLVDQYFQVPNVFDDNYITVVNDICRNNNIQLIIPIVDEELLKFATSNICKYVKMLIPTSEIINLFRDKYTATNTLKNEIGVSIPKIIYKNDYIKSAKIIIREKKSIASQGITVINKEGLSAIDFESENVFIQEFIDGTEYTVDVLCDKNGRPVLIVPRKRLQIKNGVSTKVEIVKNLKMIDLCMQIYNKFCIPGLSNIQFIEQDGLIYFIELNPRFAGMGISSVLSSYDFVSDYYLHILYGQYLGSFSKNMNKVKWGSIVCRYYEETVLSPSSS